MVSAGAAAPHVTVVWWPNPLWWLRLRLCEEVAQRRVRTRPQWRRRVCPSPLLLPLLGWESDYDRAGP